RRSLPNLQPPSSTHTSDSIQPIGFGPIPGAWSVRRERLGIRETSWTDEGWNERPLGQGFDMEYFQAAPPDQLLDELRADESITLENLCADHARFTTKLCGVRPRARAERAGRGPLELELAADSLWIDTQRGVCPLAWRGRIDLESRDQKVSIAVGAEEPGKPVRW